MKVLLPPARATVKHNAGGYCSLGPIRKLSALSYTCLPGSLRYLSLFLPRVPGTCCSLSHWCFSSYPYCPCLCRLVSQLNRPCSGGSGTHLKDMFSLLPPTPASHVLFMLLHDIQLYFQVVICFFITHLASVSTNHICFVSFSMSSPWYSSGNSRPYSMNGWQNMLASKSPHFSDKDGKGEKYRLRRAFSGVSWSFTSGLCLLEAFHVDFWIYLWSKQSIEPWKFPAGIKDEDNHEPSLLDPFIGDNPSKEYWGWRCHNSMWHSYFHGWDLTQSLTHARQMLYHSIVSPALSGMFLVSSVLVLKTKRFYIILIVISLDFNKWIILKMEVA